MWPRVGFPECLTFSCKGDILFFPSLIKIFKLYNFLAAHRNKASQAHTASVF